MHLPARLIPLVCLILLAGCGHAFGPEPMVRTTLVGRLHIGAYPIGRGWVQVLPVDGTIGILRSAPLAPDGSFRIEKAPVGRVAIGFAGPRPDPTGHPGVDAFLQRAYQSFPARRTIPPQPSVLDVDLDSERIPFEQGRNPPR